MDKDAPLRDRAVVNGAACGSAVPASVPGALYTHHHYGWRRHDLPDDAEHNLLVALTLTHDFLARYEGQYRVEIETTHDRSYQGRVSVFWNSDEPKTFVLGRSLRRGDYWFKAFEFNVAPATACGYCGGTGMDHYMPFAHCWACDGTAVQVRKSTWRGFKHKPTKCCSERAHREYAEWCAAQAMAARSGETTGSPEGNSAVRAPEKETPDA